MRVKKLARFAATVALGRAVTIVAKLFVAAMVTSVILGIVRLIGTVLQVRLPYRTITVLVALSAL
jgi:hypothetical protein